MADSARLDRRVEAILDNTRRRHSPGRVMSCFLIAMTVCSVSLIGAAKLTAVVIQSQQTSDKGGPVGNSANVLSSSVKIHGMVIGPDEQKITGAELYLNVNEYQDSIKLGKSDSDGAFQFEVPHETLKRLVSPGVFLGQCQCRW